MPELEFWHGLGLVLFWEKFGGRGGCGCVLLTHVGLGDEERMVRSFLFIQEPIRCTFTNCRFIHLWYSWV